MFPLVSIIIPVYNRLDLFEKAIDSALNQTYSHIEVIVVDDGSDEPIEALVNEKKKISRFRIHYLRQENSGPGAARNAGLNKASGVYVQYLDADDILLPEKIELQVKILEFAPEKVACLCGWEAIDLRSGKRLVRDMTNLPSDLLEAALNNRFWPTLAPLWHYANRSIPVWPGLIGGEDIVHDVSVGIHQREIVWIPDILAQITISPISTSISSRSGDRRKRRLADNFQFPFLCHEMLQAAGLLEIPRYAEPLAERCYRIGYQFAMIGEKGSAINLMTLAHKTTKSIRKCIEINLAVLAIRITKAKCPRLYLGLFKIHKLITRRSLHAGKKITTLLSYSEKNYV